RSPGAGGGRFRHRCSRCPSPPPPATPSRGGDRRFREAPRGRFPPTRAATAPAEWPTTRRWLICRNPVPLEARGPAPLQRAPSEVSSERRQHRGIGARHTVHHCRRSLPTLQPSIRGDTTVANTIDSRGIASLASRNYFF